MQGQTPTRGESPMRTPGSKPTTRTPGSGGGSQSPKKVNLFFYDVIKLFNYYYICFQIDTKLNPGTPSGEGVLANFFNSLLLKKPASSPGSGGSGGSSLTNNPSTPLSSRTSTNGLIDDQLTPDKISMRTDAAAELDRLTRSAKKDLDFTTQTDC